MKSAQEEINKVASEINLDREQVEEALKAANEAQTLEAAMKAQLHSETVDEEKQQDIVHDFTMLNADINSLEDSIWLRKGDSLKKVVGDRVEENNYKEHLGVAVHQAHLDLKRISDAMLSNKESFPRGDPRIVLFIDDLDRCPPPKVVETLEAVQLLVDSKLFVVVLAIDTRYVTLCLEEHYKNILVPKQHPSGMDYIEKIIQLPYRVPPISYECMEPYLKDQMNAKNMITRSNSAREELSDESKDNGKFSVPGQSNENTPLLSAFAGDDETPMTETSQHRPEEPLVAIPTDELDFTWEELQSLKSACVFAGVSPRSGKRLVNVFKLMKIIWYRRDQMLDEETPYEASMREASVWILALCASNSKGVRLRMCEVLGKVDQAQIMPAGCNNNLKDFVKKALGERVEGQAKDNLLTMIDDDKCSKILKEVVWNDEKEWNTTKKDLRLLRSFSFVGEYNEPVDDIHHPTQQIIAATQEKDDSVQENDSAGRAVTAHRITEARETRVKFETDLEACRHKRKEIELKYAENEKKKAKKLKPIDEEIAICKTMIKELKSTLVKYAEELNALNNDGAQGRLRHESSSSSRDDSSSDDSESDNDE